VQPEELEGFERLAAVAVHDPLGGSGRPRREQHPQRVVERQPREVVLGVGTVTSVKERTQDAEWTSASAVADAVDGLVMAFSPGVPRRSRPAALIGASAGVIGMLAARAMADERTAATTEAALVDATVGR